MGIAALLLAEGGVKSAEEKRLKIYRLGKNIRMTEVPPEGAEIKGEIIARQPTLDDVGAIHLASKDPLKQMVTAILRCAIDPATGGRAFDETATDAILSNPAGSWPRDLSDAILGLIPKSEDKAAVGEGSGETAPSRR